MIRVIIEGIWKDPENNSQLAEVFSAFYDTYKRVLYVNTDVNDSAYNPEIGDNIYFTREDGGESWSLWVTDISAHDPIAKMISTNISFNRVYVCAMSENHREMFRPCDDGTPLFLYKVFRVDVSPVYHIFYQDHFIKELEDQTEAVMEFEILHQYELAKRGDGNV